MSKPKKEKIESMLDDDKKPLYILSKDFQAAAKLMSKAEVRYLVEAYYKHQEDRIRSQHQVEALNKSGAEHQIIVWLYDRSKRLEDSCRSALAVWAKQDPMAVWAMSQKGIAHVIACGLASHIDLTKINYATSLWRYAGMDPTSVWEKGKARPWNARLKRLCWIMGESFVKVSGLEDAFYGKLWRQRKEYEVERNKNGLNRERALSMVDKYSKGTDAKEWCKKGMLPPAHIHAMSRRWIIKLFLSHYFEVGYEKLHGKKPPEPYAIARLGHVTHIYPPVPDQPKKTKPKTKKTSGS